MVDKDGVKQTLADEIQTSFILPLGNRWTQLAKDSYCITVFPTFLKGEKKSFPRKYLTNHKAKDPGPSFNHLVNKILSGFVQS